MNLSPDIANLQPLKVVEILDRALWLLRKHLVSIVKLTFFVAVTQVLTNGGLFPNSLLLTGLSIISGICGAIYIHMIIAYFAQSCWLNSPLSVAEACAKFSFRILVKSFFCGILVGLGTVFFAIFLVIPGLIYFGNRILASYEILFYDRPIRESLRKSKWLMTQKSWYSLSGPMMRISGLWIILLIVTYIILILSLVCAGLASGASFIALANPTGVARVATVFFSGWITGLTTVFSTLAMIGFYYDLRVRYEGADLLAQIGSLANESK